MIKFWSKCHFQILWYRFTGDNRFLVKYRSRELLKAIFYHKKNNNKKFLEICMKLFSDICMKCLNPQVRISKMVNEHTVDYHPSPSELTSRIHPLIYLWTAKGFIFCPEYISWIFMALRLSEISPWFLPLPLQAGGNYPFPPHNVFYVFSQRKGRRIMELKKLPKLNLKGYWSQVLINSTSFATITFLVSVLMYHNLDSSMLKCEGSLIFTKRYSVQEYKSMKGKTLPTFLIISPTIWQFKICSLISFLF